MLRFTLQCNCLHTMLPKERLNDLKISSKFPNFIWTQEGKRTSKNISISNQMTDHTTLQCNYSMEKLYCSIKGITFHIPPSIKPASYGCHH
jgi:hypothetical protein